MKLGGSEWLGFLSGAVALALLAAPAAAQTAACEALPEKARAEARAAFAALHPYACCDATFTECLTRYAPGDSTRHACPEVARVADDLCRLARAGKTAAELGHALSRRAQTMLPTARPTVVAADPAWTAGARDAPVHVVVYACTRCPFCKVIVPAMYEQLVNGALKGKVRMTFRPFPLKDHPGAMEGGLALVASAAQGRAWPMLLRLYARFDEARPDQMAAEAEAVGLSRAVFDQSVGAPKTREFLVASKQEGVRHKVASTPTFFVNGRRYAYDLSVSGLVDVLLEEAARSTPGR